LALI